MGSTYAFQNLFWISLFYHLIGDSVGDESKLIVTVPSGRVTRRVADDLNLTCKVVSDARYYISWKIPQNRQLQADRIKTEDDFNTQSVTIYQLRDFDAGVYSCIARHGDTVLRSDIVVTIVQSEPKGCSDNPFFCRNGYCIPKRYSCDGHMDCPDGSDESKGECGPDPCEDKVLCEDGRCIPRSLCCDPATDMSCQLTFLLPCCKQYLASIATEALVPSKAGGALPPHRRYSGNVEYLQSSVYTVVSCAVVFIFVATVMVAAICRIHMRRSAMAMFPTHVTPASATERHRFLPWCTHHQPRFSARPPTLNTHSCSHLPFGGNLRTVTCPHGSYVVAAYSSSQGKVHFFQHLPKPPDYSPVADDPPPPYSSIDDLRASANEPTLGNAEGGKTFHQSVQIPPSLHHLCSATLSAAAADEDNACVAAASASGESSPLLSVTEQIVTPSDAPVGQRSSEASATHVA